MVLAVLVGLGLTALPASALDHIALSEITPGMTGYGLTVFAGTEVDTFAVKVIGVQEKIRARGSLVLIEVAGHGLELSSIAQGMSGSPIYLDGRFAGALAFGWGGSLRPIAGVTPAAEMLALPTGVPSPAALGRGGSPMGLASLIGPRAIPTELAGALGMPASAGREVQSAAPMITGWPEAPQMWLTLAADLAIRHPALDQGADQWLFSPLEGQGVSTAAATSGEAAGATRTLLPGSACAVPLVVGDAALGAIGTVTWVEGDQVLMMGHPFMQRGPVNLPLATAEVLTIMPSRQMSFKMGSIGSIVGTVHHDQRAGLSGRLGKAPAMIPVDVSVVQGQADTTTYHFAVADDPLLSATLVFWSLYNALLVTGDDASLQTTRYRISTEWSGPDVISDLPLTVSGVAVGPGGAAGIATEVMGPINILLGNPHAAVRLKRVQAVLSQERPLQTARILGVSSPRASVRAGDAVVLQAVVEPRNGTRQTIDFPVTIPAQLAPGPYRVVLASAAELFALEAQRAPGRFQPEDLGSMMEILRTGRAADNLVLALLAPGDGTVVRGQELRNLPPSVARTVRAGNLQAQRTMADYVWRSERPTRWALTGHAVRSLNIQPAAKPFPDERRP